MKFSRNLYVEIYVHGCVFPVEILQACPAIAFALAAWAFAFGEIWGTTLEAIRDQFRYEDMDWALSQGAALYACYFVVSFPAVYGLDECPAAPRWSLRRVCESALAAGMGSFILLDLACRYVVTGWRSVAPLGQ